MKHLLLLLLATPALAQLPTHSEGPQLGYFASYRDNRFDFGISAKGSMRLLPADSSRKPGPFLSGRYLMEILPLVMETRTDGKTGLRRIDPQSLESAEDITDKLEKTTIRGKVSGGASIEVDVEQNRGNLLMGGKLLDPGPLKTPLRFGIQIKVPNLMTTGDQQALSKLSKAKEDDRKAQRELRDLMRKFRDDRVIIRWSDDKQETFKLADEIDAEAKTVNGAGIEELRLESARYRNRRVTFTAQTGTTLVLTPTRPGTLLAGFTLMWSPAEVVDESAPAKRLAISVR